jgi:DNA polymerase III psi subunit
MISIRQQAYLDAMEIGVWTLRETVSQPVSSSPVPSQPTSSPVISSADKIPRLKLCPGSGGILLICAADTDSASRLATDISRALGNVPVWAWPDADNAAVELTSAVEDKLFTTVAIFGNELAAQFFDGELPASLNSAKVVLLPAMHDLQSGADARQALWAIFCRAGMVSAS